MTLGALIDGKYELVEVAGEGGMATVYKAVARGAAGFARPVAIKKIKSEYRTIKNYIAMFIEEARVGAELAHPNIVQVHDFCVENGSYYLVMEWVDGMDMGTLVRMFRNARRNLPWPLVLAIMVGTLRGLGAAHERRKPDGSISPVIHRDVSPHNILLGTGGVVKLTDFGLARARDRAASLTAPGTVKGKLAYLAPEVTFGKSNSPQSDMFAVSVVGWESLTGLRLFDGKNDLEVFKKIRACVVPTIDAVRNDVPGEVELAMRKGLSVSPEARYGSAMEYAGVLAELLARHAHHDGTAMLAKTLEALRPPAGAVAPPAPALGRTTDDVPTDVMLRPPGPGEVDVEFSAPDLRGEVVPLTPKR